MTPNVGKDPVDQARAKIQRYWNIDGLHEIAIGVLFALTAVWVWGSDLSSLPKVWKNAFSATFPILLCGGIAVEGHLVKAIRRRLTYPRAGFAETRQPSRRRTLIGGGTAFIVAAIVAYALYRFGGVERFAVLLVAVGLGLFLCQMAARSGVVRFYALGIFLTAVGAAITLAGASTSVGMAAYWTVAAAAFSVSGGLTLRRFLRA